MSALDTLAALKRSIQRSNTVAEIGEMEVDAITAEVTADKARIAQLEDVLRAALSWELGNHMPLSKALAIIAGEQPMPDIDVPHFVPDGVATLNSNKKG